MSMTRTSCLLWWSSWWEWSIQCHRYPSSSCDREKETLLPYEIERFARVYREVAVLEDEWNLNSSKVEWSEQVAERMSVGVGVDVRDCPADSDSFASIESRWRKNGAASEAGWNGWEETSWMDEKRQCSVPRPSARAGPHVSLNE